MQNEILSYTIDDLEYFTLKAAQDSMEGIVKTWHSKYYHRCMYCGDSMLGYDENGNQVCEILFLSNGLFCSAEKNNQVCGYEKDGQ